MKNESYAASDTHSPNATFNAFSLYFSIWVKDEVLRSDSGAEFQNSLFWGLLLSKFQFFLRISAIDWRWIRKSLFLPLVFFVFLYYISKQFWLLGFNKEALKQRCGQSWGMCESDFPQNR